VDNGKLGGDSTPSEGGGTLKTGFGREKKKVLVKGVKRKGSGENLEAVQRVDSSSGKEEVVHHAKKKRNATKKKRLTQKQKKVERV